MKQNLLMKKKISVKKGLDITKQKIVKESIGLMKGWTFPPKLFCEKSHEILKVCIQYG